MDFLTESDFEQATEHDKAVADLLPMILEDLMSDPEIGEKIIVGCRFGVVDIVSSLLHRNSLMFLAVRSHFESKQSILQYDLDSLREHTEHISDEFRLKLLNNVRAKVYGWNLTGSGSEPNQLSN